MDWNGMGTAQGCVTLCGRGRRPHTYNTKDILGTGKVEIYEYNTCESQKHNDQQPTERGDTLARGIRGEREIAIDRVEDRED